MNEKLDQIRDALIHDFNEGNDNLYEKLRKYNVNDEQIVDIILEKNKQRSDLMNLKSLNLDLINVIKDQSLRIDKLNETVNQNKKFKFKSVIGIISLTFMSLSSLLGLVLLYKFEPIATNAIFTFIINVLEEISKIFSRKS